MPERRDGEGKAQQGNGREVTDRGKRGRTMMDPREIRWENVSNYGNVKERA